MKTEKSDKRIAEIRAMMKDPPPIGCFGGAIDYLLAENQIMRDKLAHASAYG